MDTAQRKADAAKGQAMPGGRYPIENREQLGKAIHAVGRAKGGSAGRAAVRRFIMKRAKELNATDMIPGSWRSDGTLWTTAADMADDRRHGIKEDSPRDKKLDAMRGVGK